MVLSRLFSIIQQAIDTSEGLIQNLNDLIHADNVRMATNNSKCYTYASYSYD